MYSVWFDGIKSWEDLYLVPVSRPVVSPPAIKTNYVDIPGSSGSLDLTEVLTGKPLYSDRNGSFDFIVLRKNMSVSVFDEEKGIFITPDLSGLKDETRYPFDGHTAPDTSRQMYWMYRYQDILEKIHAKTGALVISEDPEYFYKSRFLISGWETGEQYSTITINYIASPFKYPIEYIDLYNDRELEEYGVL